MTYVVLALISAFFWAFSTFLLKIGLRAADPIFTATIQATIANFFLIVAYIGVHGITKQDHLDFSGLSFIALAGIAGGLSWLFYIQALKYGPLTHVASIEPTNIVFIVILGALLLGEWRIQYFIGAILITLGTCLVTM
jgi:transporter family protein